MTKSAKKVQPQAGPRVLTVPVMASDQLEEVERKLAKLFPEWKDLNGPERRELVDLSIAHRKSGEPVRVELKPKPQGGYTIELVGESKLLAALKLQKALGTNSIDAVNARASELLDYLESAGACNDTRYNAALSFVESMKPQDQVEALLLVQMYVTHDAAIRALSHLGKAEWMPHAQTFGNLASKLLRTSQGQMETLARLRRGGEQVVGHVHVDNRGGQAVIAASINSGGQQNAETAKQSHAPAAGTAGSSTPLPCPDPCGNGVPITSGDRQAAMQDARRS